MPESNQINNGKTVAVIEQNLDVMAYTDWIGSLRK